jgi:autonomous glycyl radical cofactor GrcA
MHQKTNCKKCKKQVEAMDLFSGGICLDCYKVAFDKLTPEQQRPDFVRTLTIK